MTSLLVSPLDRAEDVGNRKPDETAFVSSQSMVCDMTHLSKATREILQTLARSIGSDRPKLPLDTVVVGGDAGVVEKMKRCSRMMHGRRLA